MVLVYVCYALYRINKEQKKTVMLLTKMFEQSGGRLLEHEEDFLEG